MQTALSFTKFNILFQRKFLSRARPQLQTRLIKLTWTLRKHTWFASPLQISSSRVILRIQLWKRQVLQVSTLYVLIETVNLIKVNYQTLLHSGRIIFPRMNMQAKSIREILYNNLIFGVIYEIVLKNRTKKWM